MKKKKLLIIIIIMIVVLAVAGTVFGYLFVATDTFKSDKELFAKYMTQNTEMLKEITDLKAKEMYQNLENESKFEVKTEVNTTYSEGGEVSNPVNELGAQIDIQKDSENEYFYADAQILFAEEEYLEAEVIKEQGLYGVRFSDVAKQFMTVTKDEQVEKVAQNIGIELYQLEDIMDILDGTKNIKDEIISEEQINSLKDKYLTIITETISNGTFGSQKKAMITYNNVTTKTNAYTVMVSSEQVEQMLIKILNNLKTEEIILNNIESETYVEQIDEIIKKFTEEIELPTIKISLFEQNQKTLRTVIEIGNYKIIIENSEENGSLKTQIQLFISSEDRIDEYEIVVSKIASEQQEEFNIVMETGEEETYIISFLNEMKILDDEIEINSSINYKKDIIEAAITLNNNIIVGRDFEKKQTLETTNNLLLNNVEEGRRVEIINLLKEKVPEKVAVRLKLLAEVLGIEETENNGDVTDADMTQVEINKFNAKFEFYTGDSVSAENVTTLLGIVKDNLAGCEISKATVEGQEDEENTKYNIKLIIEKNKTNEEAINQALEKIEDRKKYKVLISYKEQNGLIDYITIDEVEE